MAESAPLDLSPQEQRFVEEYCKDKNQVRAALAAGLSSTYFGAAQAARVLLKNPQIRTAVRRVFAVQSRRLKTEIPDVVREWAILGKSDLTDYVVDDDGRVTTAPGVPRSALRAVKKVKQTRTERLDRQSNELVVELKTEIELHGKDGPLAKLYEHFGAVPGEEKAGANVELAATLAALLAARLPAGGGPGGTAGPVPGGPAVGAEPGAAGPGVPVPG
jgi:hypothetical protein